MSFKETISLHPFVLVDFYATWCEPCKWADPILRDVIKHFGGQINLHKVDIDVDPETARSYHILSVPTLILFKSGEEVWRMRGFDTAAVLSKALAEHL